MKTLDIELCLIDPPTDPHRLSFDEHALDQLSDSIRDVGLLQPILVERHGKRFTIIAGHRRYLAHQRLSKNTIRAQINDDNRPRAAHRMSMAENLQRSDLSPIEEARQLVKMRDEGELDVNASARAVNRRPEWVVQRLKLLELPEDLLPFVHTKQLTISNALLLGKIEDQQHRAYLTGCAVDGGASLFVVEGWVQSYIAQRESNPGAAPALPEPAEPGKRYVVELICFACGKPHDHTKMALVRLDPDCFKLLSKSD